MSDLIIAGGTDEEQEETLKYEATETDEEKFFLIYHLHMSVTDADTLDPDRRKWIIARFMAQKNMEREVIQQQRLAAQIMPDLTGGKPPLRR